MKEVAVLAFFALVGVLLWTGYKWGEMDANYEHYRAVKNYERYKCKDGTVYQRTLSGYWEDMKKSCRNEEQM